MQRNRFAPLAFATVATLAVATAQPDVAVATELQSGGYLSHFLIEAVDRGRHMADTNRDGVLNAAELSQFIYEGYRDQVMDEGVKDALDASENLGYQQLVVDRGGVDGHHALFQLR